MAASRSRPVFADAATLTRNDALWIALAALLTAAITTALPPFAAGIAAAAAALFFAALLLDAILDRVFTIELGPHGIGGVIFSDLYRQLRPLDLRSRSTPKLLVLDGNPSRERSSSYGALLGDRKLAVDLVRDTVIESDLRDAGARTLTGDERAYAHQLLTELLRRRGIL